MSVGATLGLDASRTADPARYAIGSVTPRAAIRPADRNELLEVLKAASHDSLAVVPWGGGVAAATEQLPPRYDLAIDLTALDRIVEYEPQDLTLTAECGATIAALRAALAEHGQELPLEAALADRATLGGVLAANASGPRRLHFGAPRDRLLGAAFALGDGTLAHSGGRVVKSVAGYATHRLLCGSRGGLAIFVDATLKLLPSPATRRALIFDVDAAAIADASRWAPLPRLEPVALTVLGSVAAATCGLEPKTSFVVIAGLEGDGPWVERQADLVAERLGQPARQFEGEDASALWQKLADLEEQPGIRITFTTAHHSPEAIVPFLTLSEKKNLVFHAPAGRLHLFSDTVMSLEIPEFAPIGTRGITRPDDASGTATTRLRSRIRSAMDAPGCMAWGERWEREGG